MIFSTIKLTTHPDNYVPLHLKCNSAQPSHENPSMACDKIDPNQLYRAQIAFDKLLSTILYGNVSQKSISFPYPFVIILHPPMYMKSDKVLTKKRKMKIIIRNYEGQQRTKLEKVSTSSIIWTNECIIINIL